MFAVIKTGGKQYRVQKGDVLEVEKLDVKDGKDVTFKEVLLVEDNGKTLVGTPLVDKAQVLAVVVASFKGDKVIVFKKKRRKQYKKKRGHRQELTRVKIEEIVYGDKAPAKKKPAAKVAPPKEKEAAPKPKPKAELEAKKAVKKEKPAEPRKEEPKKPAAKAAPAKPKEEKKTVAKEKPKEEKKAATKPKPKAKKETATKE